MDTVDLAWPEPARSTQLHPSGCLGLPGHGTDRVRDISAALTRRLRCRGTDSDCADTDGGSAHPGQSPVDAGCAGGGPKAAHSTTMQSRHSVRFGGCARRGPGQLGPAGRATGRHLPGSLRQSVASSNRRNHVTVPVGQRPIRRQVARSRSSTSPSVRPQLGPGDTNERPVTKIAAIFRWLKIRWSARGVKHNISTCARSLSLQFALIGVVL